MSSPMATAGSTSSADNTASSPAALSTNLTATPFSVASASSAPGSVFKKKKHIAFWDVDGPGVDGWIGTIPGPFQNHGTDAPASADGDGDEQGTYDVTIPYNIVSTQVFRRLSSRKHMVYFVLC